jgi:hypothetical protein
LAPFAESERRLAEKRFRAPSCPGILKLFFQPGVIVKTDVNYELRRSILWGLVLIALGVAFLLDRADILDIDQVWHYWPLILVGFGVNKMIAYATARQFVGGLWLVFLGLWLFASSEQLFGLSFYNSWPILVIAWGAALIVEPIAKKFLASPMEPHHEK